MPVAIAAVVTAAAGVYGATQGNESSSSGTSIGGTKSSSKSELNLMDKLSKGYLDKFTGGLSATVEGQTAFDPAAAAASASGVVKSIFDAYQKTALPKIADMSNRGGSYDSTAHQLMANDAFAKATAEASDTVLRVVQDQQKFKLQQDMMQQDELMKALGLQAEVTQRQKTKSNSQSVGATSGAAATSSNWATGLVSGIGSGAQAYAAMNSKD